MIPFSERSCWEVHERINERGIPVDIPGLQQAHRLALDVERMYEAEVQDITGGTLQDATNRYTLCEWLSDVTGSPVVSVAKDKVVDMLDGELRDDVRRVLEIRQIVGQTAAKKFAGLLNRASRDGRVKGCYVFSGAASTGRWASVGVNLQNFFRPKIKNPDELANNIHHVTAEDLVMLYGDPMGALGSIARAMLCAEDGKEFRAADYSAVESVMTAYHAGEEWKLDVFRGDKKIYERVAAEIYGVPFEEILDGSNERQAGKVVDLACVAGDTKVLTRTGEVRIDQLTTFHQLWDGVEFVNHQGVVNRGKKDVLDYQGLTATPDHIVFLEDGGTCEFINAARRGARITQTGISGTNLFLREGSSRYFRVQGKLEGPPGFRSVRELRTAGVDRLEYTATRQDERLPPVQYGPQSTELAVEKGLRREATLRKPRKSLLQKLRGSWDTFLFFLAVGDGGLGSRKLEPAETAGRLGPYRQRSGVRTGESSLGEQDAEQLQPTRLSCPSAKLARDELAVRSGDGGEKDSRGEEPVGDTRGSTLGGITEEERLAFNFRTAEVYDVVESGPRNRFTANGLLVHNCGFGGGMGAIGAMAESYGLDLEAIEASSPDHIRRKVDAVKIDVEDEDHTWWPNSITRGQAFAEFCKRRWRDANKMTSKKKKWDSVREERVGESGAWEAHQDAAVKSIQNPGKAIRCETATPASYMTFRNGGYMMCRLPTGRCIPYVRPYVVEGDMGMEIRYEGLNAKTRQWVKKKTYGGDLFQSYVQGSCREFLARALVQLDAEGFSPVAHVHDEIIVEQDVDDRVHSLDRLKEIMTTPQVWAPDFPISTDDGYCARRYRK